MSDGITRSFPDWLYELLDDPEEHDSEWGRSCHFCGSQHGHYDAPLEHYIDCPWLIACTRAGVEIDLTKHIIFEPKPCESCPKCGWHYDSPSDWRGREMPEPATPEQRIAHDTHVAEEHGITYEEYLAGPPNQGPWPSFWHDGPMRWHDRWMREEFFNRLPTVTTQRGSISFIKPPDLPDEAVRSDSE